MATRVILTGGQVGRALPEIPGLRAQIKFNELTTVHLGDVRIVVIRGGKVVFQTRDHSEVQEMIDQGQVTPEQALALPNRNRVTRAITGDFGWGDQSDSHGVENRFELQPSSELPALVKDKTASGALDAVRAHCATSDDHVSIFAYHHGAQ